MEQPQQNQQEEQNPPNPQNTQKPQINIQPRVFSNQQNRVNIQKQNSQDQTNRVNIQIPTQKPNQQNEPKQQEEKPPEEQAPHEEQKTQEEPKNHDQISSQSSHSDTPRVEVKKRSSDTKLQLTLKSGQQLISKPDNQSQKALNIVTPNKDSQQQPQQQNLIRTSSSEPLVKIEKRQKKADAYLNIDLKYDVYDVETLKKSETQSFEARTPKSRGFVSLQNYLLEMKNEKSGKSQYGYGRPQRSRSKQNMANLIVSGGTNIDNQNDTKEKTFVPTAMLKNVNMWDSESDEAFKMNVNQSFNRLTKEKINQVLNDLIPRINTPKREELVADIFVNKASSEKGFASTYAEFVKELSKSHKSIAQNIINVATDKLDDYALNPPDEQDDYECESSIGYSTFVAALISNGIIEDGSKFLKNIIDFIPDSSINPTLIEMLKNFVISVGKTFISKVDKKFFEKLEQLQERKDIPSRVHYLIVDTLEIINGTNIEEKTTQKVTESSKSLVRNGFASFQEDYTIIPSEVQNMPSIVFFEGSMILFPDIKDIYDFTYYQCFVLKKNQYKKHEIIEMLQKYIRSFAEQQIEMDVRHIWTNISTLLCQMIIHGIINPYDAQNLHKQIYYQPNDPTPNDDWNPINELKFFILDNIDFSEPIEIPNTRDQELQEIADALRMPATINNPNVTEIKKVSRLIAIAVVRSVFAQFRLGNDQNISGLSRWKGILSSVYKRAQKAFTEALEEDFKEYDYVFDQDAAIKYIS